MFKRGFWLPLIIGVAAGASVAFADAVLDGDRCTTYEEQAACPTGRFFAAPDTINAVVIYCKSYFQSPKLPVFAKDVWDTLQQNSVPTFYNQNTNGKLKIIAKAYGANGLIDGEPGDTLAFVSDSPILPVNQPGGGASYFNNIFSKADQVIDFSQFVPPGDTVVEMVFFVMVDNAIQFGWSDMVPPSVTCPVPTDNFLPNGKRVYLNTGVTISALDTDGRDGVVGVSSHEFGHRCFDFIRDSLNKVPPFLGVVPTLQDVRGDPVGNDNFWGVGAFSVMGVVPSFQNRTSPIDPYHRTAMRVTNLVTVNSPIYNAQIPDYFRSDTVYQLKADEREYFLVSNQKADATPAFWEQNFPGKGLLLWHTVDSVKCQICENHKNQDLEWPRGLFTLINPSVNCDFPTQRNLLDFNSPNDSLGSDSLDQRCFFFRPNVGSGSFFWSDSSLRRNFDDKTNPSSRAYQLVGGTWMQNRFSKVGVEEIKGFGGTMTADLVVNAKYGDVTANTTWGPGLVGVIGDVRVKNGATLTIAAGTTIKFQRNYDNQKLGSDTTKCGVTVESGGYLLVNGTSGSPVLFVSSSTSPGTNDWEGILVKSGGSAKISYAHIRNAYTGISYQNVSAADTLRNVHIARCEIIGIRADTTPNLVIRNCGIDSIRTSGAGTGIAVWSGASGGPLIRSCSTRACYTGMDIWRWASVESCQILGLHTSGDFISRTGIKASGQGDYSPVTELNVSATTISGYFADQHFQNAALDGRSSLTLCNILSLETTRSPYGVRNTGGEYFYMRYSTVTHWGTTGVLVENNGGATVTDLGTVSSPTDSGYNTIFSSVSGSTWKYVLDNDCGSCSTPTLKAEWNCWGVVNPSSTRFSSNVDYLPRGVFCVDDPDFKIAGGEGDGILPKQTELFQNYPNPFNPSTQIQFNLDKTERVHLHIFNILGQKVRVMLSGEEFSAGPYTFVWNGRDDGGSSVASGAYFYKLSTPSYSQTKKMMFIK